MKVLDIALVGGSGLVGTAILLEALSRGHRVTAMARHPERITLQHPHLRVRAIDVMAAADLVPAIVHHDVLVNACKPPWGMPGLYERFLKGALFIQHAVKAAAVSRLLFIGHAGSLYVAPSLQWVDTSEYPVIWRPISAASRDYLDLLLESTDLDWTYVTPPLDMPVSTAGIRTGVYRTGTDSPIYDGQGSSIISVADLAVAVLDELESPQYRRQRFTVGY